MAIVGDYLACWSVGGDMEIFQPGANQTGRLVTAATLRPPLASYLFGGTPTLITLDTPRLRRWNLRDGTVYSQHTLPDLTDPADVLGASSDCELWAVRRTDGLSLIKMNGEQEVTRIVRPAGRFEMAALSLEIGLLVTNGPAGSVWAFDLNQLLAAPHWRMPSTSTSEFQRLGLNMLPRSLSGAAVVQTPPLLPTDQAPTPPIGPARGPSSPAQSAALPPAAGGSTEAVVLNLKGASHSAGPNLVEGWEFKSNRSLWVTQLGIYDYHADGLSLPHDVAIWNVKDESKPVVQATVPAGTAAPLEGAFRFVRIQRVKLEPGESYAIVAHYPEANDHSVSSPNLRTLTAEFAPQLTVAGRRFAFPHKAMAFPRLFSSGAEGVSIGPTFRFDLTP
jgi:hypothetical protein